MSVKLSGNDFQQLTGIIQRLPDFGNVRDRRRLVAGALEGVPRADVILSRLDLDGTPMAVSVEVVRFLAQFGQVAYGKEALGVFLNYVQPFLGNEDAALVAGLFGVYPLSEITSASPTISRWLGHENVFDIHEKIIGEDTLHHVRFLELALTAADAVVHLHVTKDDGRSVLGTGFIIASDLVITNNHVVTNSSEAESVICSFNYQLNLRGELCKPTSIMTRGDGMFHTNEMLDYTVFQLADSSPATKLSIAVKQVRRDDRVTIIQHPGGHLKKISLQNNFVAYADNQVVQYTTSTLPGSSGSPVMNDTFDVVALHHSGGMILEPSTMRQFLRNEGISMIAVLQYLKHDVPHIHARLKE